MIKRALAALTLRGRAVAAGGLMALVAAFGLGDRDLGRLGLLLLVLPGLAAFSVARARTHLATARSLTAARVPAGEVVDVRIALSNLSRVPSGVLLAEDTLPLAFGGRPRFVVERMAGGSKVEVQYPVRCDLRGRYRLGPVTVRLRDPFGLSELVRGFDDIDEIVVTPAIRQLPAARLTGEWAGLGESTRRSVATAGEDDASTREYRLGDDLRRVHWRSTAKRGELMVRREEQPWQSRAALLLDTRNTVHAGDGAASSLEWAVSAAASISVYLDKLGFQLRLVFDSGVSVAAAETGEQFIDTVLESLATCGPSRGGGLTAGLGALRHGGGEGLIVAVLAGIGMSDVEPMLRARGAGVTGVAVVLDTAGWLGGSQAHNAAASTVEQKQAVELLAGAGWRVVVAHRDSDLGELWRRLDASRYGDPSAADHQRAAEAVNDAAAVGAGAQR